LNNMCKEEWYVFSFTSFMLPNALLPPPQSHGNQYRGCGVLTCPIFLVASESLTHHQSPAFFCNSTTFGCTGRGIGPIVVHRTVSIASRIDTKRHGRAGVIGYDASPPFLVSFLVLIFLFNCWCHATHYFPSLFFHPFPSLHPQTIYEDRHVLNLIQEPCDNCKEASYDRGRRR
jgi:hypothetical protein